MFDILAMYVVNIAKKLKRSSDDKDFQDVVNYAEKETRKQKKIEEAQRDINQLLEFKRNIERSLDCITSRFELVVNTKPHSVFKWFIIDTHMRVNDSTGLRYWGNTIDELQSKWDSLQQTFTPIEQPFIGNRFRLGLIKSNGRFRFKIHQK